MTDARTQTRRFRHHCCCTVIFLWTLSGLCAAQTPVGTGFNYQGRIKQNGSLINGLCDFKFTLWNHPSDNQSFNQVGFTLTFEGGNALDVKYGLFNKTLDFGVGAFNGEARWLELAIRFPAASGAYLTVSPRQGLNPSPYAMSAAGWKSINGNTSLTGGNVGIGTDSPADELSVAGTVNVDSESSNTGSLYPGLVFGFSSLEGIASKRTTGDNQFGLDFYTDGARRISITETGNVGIGTHTPTTDLHVASASAGPTSIYVQSLSSTSNAGISLNVPDTSAYDYINFNRGEINRFQISLAADDSLRFQNSNGDDRVWMPNCGSPLVVFGATQSQANECSSDHRLKTNVEAFSGALTIAHALQAVRFNWRVDEFPEYHFQDHRQIGFIAQDVQHVLPEVVGTGVDGYLTVDYARLTPVLVEAVKELHGIVQDRSAKLEQQQHQLAEHQAQLHDKQHQIDDLHATIAELQAGLRQLTSRLERIEHE